MKHKLRGRSTIGGSPISYPLTLTKPKGPGTTRYHYFTGTYWYHYLDEDISIGYKHRRSRNTESWARLVQETKWVNDDEEKKQYSNQEIAFYINWVLKHDVGPGSW
jgi:hypothetical protein